MSFNKNIKQKNRHTIEQYSDKNERIRVKSNNIGKSQKHHTE